MHNSTQKVALVTGVSSGIGKAIAERLSREGFRVFGTSRQLVLAMSLPGIEPLQLDVTQDDSVAAVVQTVMDRAGRIDLLVNNAGFGMYGGAEESSIEQANRLFDTNFFGGIRMIRAVLPHMRAQGRGRILNVSSVLGFLAAPYMAIYAASKHAMEGYSISLDHEIRHLGIRVVLVQPAYTKTSFEQSMVLPDQLMPEYTAERARMKVLVAKTMEEKGDLPDVVALEVLKAATDAQPKLRYTAGPLAKQLSILKRFAPASLMDGTLRKQMGLPRTH